MNPGSQTSEPCSLTQVVNDNLRLKPGTPFLTRSHSFLLIQIRDEHGASQIHLLLYPSQWLDLLHSEATHTHSILESGIFLVFSIMHVGNAQISEPEYVIED